MAWTDRGRRRVLFDGRAGGGRRRLASRHARNEPSGVVAPRDEDGARAGGHALARSAGSHRPASVVGADHAQLRQLHHRRLGVGQRPWPLCRPRAPRAFRAGAATGAGGRRNRRGRSPDAAQALPRRDRRLWRHRRDHGGGTQHSHRALRHELAAAGLSHLVRARSQARQRKSAAQRRPDAAQLRRGRGRELASLRQAADPWRSV